MRTPSRAPIVCDVSAAEASLGTVDGLARLQLAARRVGREVRLRSASPELVGLVELVGLSDVLRVQSGREPEEREDPFGVEEERQLDDLTA
jgi:hypothetical protein